MITESVEKEVIEYAAEKGILIEPNAIALLSSLKDYREMINDFLEKGELTIDEKKIKASLLRKETKIKGVEETVIVRKSGFNAEARDLDPKLRIMEEYDITGKSYSEGKLKDFLSLFRDKFQFLSSVLRRRQGFDPRAISRVARSSKGRDVEFIGMVNRKWISKKGNLVFEVEDLDSKIIALASNNEKQLFEFAQSVILDDVIGIKPGDSGGTAELVFYRFGTTMVNDTDELPLPMRPYTKGFVDYGVAQAKYKDGKMTAYRDKLSESQNAKEQFLRNISPRDKSGPTIIDIIESISGDDMII